MQVTLVIKIRKRETFNCFEGALGYHINYVGSCTPFAKFYIIAKNIVVLKHVPGSIHDSSCTHIHKVRREAAHIYRMKATDVHWRGATNVYGSRVQG